MNSFNVEYPLIFTIYIFIFLYKILLKENPVNLYFPNFALLNMKDSKSIKFINLYKHLGIFLAIVSLSSPVLVNEYINISKQGRDIIMLLDSSASMSEFGFDKLRDTNNKFYTVKEIAKNFVKKRIIDRIGVIIFADFPFILSPLTFEKKFLEEIIKNQELGLAGRNTAINDALLKAYEILLNSKNQSKIIILLTDGRDNISKISLDEIKSVIKESSVTLYTIGIIKDKNMNINNYLQDLAKIGNGEYFEASDKLKLEKIYNKINQIEKSNLENIKVLQNDYLYIYTLFLSILSFLIFFYSQEKIRFK